MKEKIFDNQKVTSNSDQLNALRAILPECFDKEGNVIRAKFEAILEGNRVDFSRENYTLNWLGKSYARVLANEKPLSVIREDEAFNANKNSGNLLIKGDNLEALKHLKNAYYQSVKMIYIDPPYNTGDDFIYHDSRHFTPEELASKAGIGLDEAARLLEFNAKGSNTHSAWLTFMFPRLKLARELLREDGVIFISIDDNEQAQLKLLCDEVFGEGNFVDNIFVIDNLKGRSNDNFVSNVGHKILIYSKNKQRLQECGGFQMTENNYGDTFNQKYKWIDDYGYYTINQFKKTGTDRKREDRKDSFYPILVKNNEIYGILDEEYNRIFDRKTGLFNDSYLYELKDKYEKLGYIFILPMDKDGDYLRWTSSFYAGFKKLLSDGDLIAKDNAIEQKKRPQPQEEFQYYASGIIKSVLYSPRYAKAIDDIKNLFGKEVFSFPKSIDLIQKLLQISTTPTAGGGGVGAILCSTFLPGVARPLTR